MRGPDGETEKQRRRDRERYRGVRTQQSKNPVMEPRRDGEDKENGGQRQGKRAQSRGRGRRGERHGEGR